MVVWDRQKQELVYEKDYSDKTLKFLYESLPGNLLVSTIVSRHWFSKLNAKYKKSKLSVKDIKPFIKEYNIDMSEYRLNGYESFNDFFTRRRMIRNKCTDNKELLAIADAKLSVYKIEKDLTLEIKGNTYTLKELVGKNIDLEKFKDGNCLVYRMTVDDYHRYHFLDSGKVIQKYSINGKLHTVQDVAKKYKVLNKNHRYVTIMETDNFGDVIQIEVGATFVGSIKNNSLSYFNRLNEKGYFEYGGSTIVVLLNDKVEIDEDIRMQSICKTEVKVKIGDKIGRLKED